MLKSIIGKDLSTIDWGLINNYNFIVMLTSYIIIIQQMCIDSYIIFKLILKTYDFSLPLTHACAHTHPNTHKHTHTHLHTTHNTHTHKHTQASTHTHIRTLTHTCIHKNKHTNTRTHMHAHTHTHTHTHKHIDTPIHRRIHAQTQHTNIQTLLVIYIAIWVFHAA